MLCPEVNPAAGVLNKHTSIHQKETVMSSFTIDDPTVVRPTGVSLWRRIRAFGSRVGRAVRGLFWRSTATVTNGAKRAWRFTTHWAKIGAFYAIFGLRRTAHYTRRGVGFVGASFAYGVSWTFSMIGNAISLMSLGLLLIVVGVVAGVFFIVRYWDSYVTGTFRYFGQKDMRGTSYRDYIRAYKIAQETGEAVTVDSFGFVEVDHTRDPAHADFKLTEREEFLLFKAHEEWAANQVEQFEKLGMVVDWTIDENGVVGFNSVNVNDAIFDIELREMLVDDNTKLNQMLDLLNAARDSANDKKQRAYIVGRAEALETTLASRDALTEKNKVWALISAKYRPNQSEIPASPLKKGFEDMTQELVDASIVHAV